MSLADQPVLVTGGAGFIGSHLVERLLAEGHAVTVIDDGSTGRWENLAAAAAHSKFQLIKSKVSQCAALVELAKSAPAIFHLAASVGVELVVNSPSQIIKNNLHETEVLLEAALPARTPVLLTSTSEVYGKSQKPAFTEEDDLLIGPPHFGRWSYACSKLMDEFMALAYAREFELPVVVARLFNTVGPRQTGSYGMVLPRFIAAAQAGAPLRVYGDGLQTRCFCHVADTVESLIRLQRTTAAHGQVFNVGGTEEISILELAETVIAVLQSKSTIEFVPYQEAYAPGFEDMRRRKPVVDKLFQTVGFRPVTSLREIIESAAAVSPA